MKTLSLGMLLLTILNGCVSNSEKRTWPRFQNTDVSFSTENKPLQELFDLAEKKAKENIILYPGEYRVMKEGSFYPYVWLETQPMGGGMYANRDIEIAYNNICIFLNNAHENGVMPSMILDMKDDIYDIGDRLTMVDDGAIGLYFGSLQGLYLSEEAFELSYLLNENKVAFLEELKTGLKSYDDYLWRVRDSDGDGCLELWSMTDSGEDNIKRLQYAPWYWPFDYPPSEETIPLDDTEFMKEKWDLTGWETFTLDKMPVPMESMDVMGYSYSCRNILYEIAKLQGDEETAKYWREKADEVSNKMRDYLWIDDRHAYFFRDTKNEFIDSMTHNNLRMMYYGTMTQDMADRFIKYHLLNPDEFWTPMPLPSVAANDPHFENKPFNHWGGQPQGLTYQRAIRALENYGHNAEVALIGHKLLNNLAKYKLFTQQFDPFTGIQPEDEDADGYGPLILSVLEYFSRMYGIDVCKDTVHFNGLPLDEEYEYTQVIGDNKYTLQQKDNLLSAKVNDKLIFTCTAGVKVKTNLQGEIIELVGIDSVTRDIDINFDDKNYNFTASPNTTYIFNEGSVVKRKVPFDYPYKK